jgi:hypothetical protein
MRLRQKTEIVEMYMQLLTDFQPWIGEMNGVL